MLKHLHIQFFNIILNGYFKFRDNHVIMNKVYLITCGTIAFFHSSLTWQGAINSCIINGEAIFLSNSECIICGHTVFAGTKAFNGEVTQF